MKENPILFSGEMVKAILERQKTQTRRIMKPQPDFSQVRFNGRKWEMYLGYPVGHGAPKCPYGEPRSRLWVRETFCYESIVNRRVVYKADGFIPWNNSEMNGVWRPSIHMPRWASRITLTIKDTRFEPLQSITEADAIAEGFACVADFSRLWDGINAKRGYPWESNPFVWVIEFEAGG